MSGNLPGILDPQQMCYQSCVVKIQLGRFYQPLADIGKIGRQVEKERLSAFADDGWDEGM